MNAVIALIPSLVGLAEKIFSKKKSGEVSIPGGEIPEKQGPQKLAFVLVMCEFVYDKALVKVFPDVKNFNEKEWFLDCCKVTIEHAVRAMNASQS